MEISLRRTLRFLFNLLRGDSLFIDSIPSDSCVGVYAYSFYFVSFLSASSRSLYFLSVSTFSFLLLIKCVRACPFILLCALFFRCVRLLKSCRKNIFLILYFKFSLLYKYEKNAFIFDVGGDFSLGVLFQG